MIFRPLARLLAVLASLGTAMAAGAWVGQQMPSLAGEQAAMALARTVAAAGDALALRLAP